MTDRNPHNVEAEQALLGCLLDDNETYHRVADTLRAEHFYDPVHGRIYQAAIGLIGKGQLADPVTLKGHFEAEGSLNEIGGVEYLVTLVIDAPDPISAGEYGKIISDLSMRRALISLAEELRAEAQSSEIDTPAIKIAEETEQKLFTLSESGIRSKGFISFDDGVAQTIATAEAAYKNGGLVGLSTGLMTLDHKLGGLHDSDLLILAGRPSMGKTALATNIAFNIAQYYRKNNVDATVGFYSLEMSAEQLTTRIISDYCGINGYMIRQGKLTADQIEKLHEARREVGSTPLWIDDTGGISIGNLCARARRLKRTKGLGVLFVDYLQLITGSGNGRENRVQEVSQITMALKSLAKELNIPIVALSQLSRQVEQRDDKKPQLSDLRESGSIEQDADAVMFVYREAYYHERLEPSEGSEEWFAWDDHMRQIRYQAEVIIGKQRHGPIGTVRVGFDPERTKFSDLAAEYEN